MNFRLLKKFPQLKPSDRLLISPGVYTVPLCDTKFIRIHRILGVAPRAYQISVTSRVANQIKPRNRLVNSKRLALPVKNSSRHQVAALLAVNINLHKASLPIE